MANRVYEWVDERTGIKPAVDYVMYRRIPKSVNWFFTMGSASLTVFIIQFTTGIFLGMNYTPSTASVPLPDGTFSNEALESVKHLTQNVPFGEWVRGLHKWGASAMVAVVFIHMLRVYFMGSYKYPRELTWFVGVVILLLTIGFGLTGYLLPWDNRAYWATQVAVKIAGSAPVLGDAVANVLQGGPRLGAATVSRFYAIHVLLLPILMVTLIGIHLFLVIKIGISGMPKAKETSSDSLFEAADVKTKKAGRAFFPYVIFKDAVVSLVVVAIIVALTIISPPENSNPADPNNPISTVVYKDGRAEQVYPQPEWYFLFLFQFLKYFPTEVNFGLFQLSGEAIGGVIIPTLLVLLLLAVPILDRGPKRNPFNRPITSLVMVAALIAIIGLTVAAYIDIGNQQKAPGAVTNGQIAAPLQTGEEVVAFGGASSIIIPE